MPRIVPYVVHGEAPGESRWQVVTPIVIGSRETPRFATRAGDVAKRLLGHGVHLLPPLFPPCLQDRGEGPSIIPVDSGYRHGAAGCVSPWRPRDRGTGSWLCGTGRPVPGRPGPTGCSRTPAIVWVRAFRRTDSAPIGADPGLREVLRGRSWPKARSADHEGRCGDGRERLPGIRS